MLGPSVSALAPSHSDAPSVRGILAAETLRSESVKVRIPGTWGDTGQIVVTSTTPLPSTVVCFTFEFSTG